MGDAGHERGQQVAMIVAAIVGAAAVIVGAYIQRPIPPEVSRDRQEVSTTAEASSFRKTPKGSNPDDGNSAPGSIAPAAAFAGPGTDHATAESSQQLPAAAANARESVNPELSNHDINPAGFTPTSTRTDTQRAARPAGNVAPPAASADRMPGTTIIDSPAVSRAEPESTQDRLRRVYSDGIYTAVPQGGTLPEELERIVPTYPREARVAGIQGSAVVRGIVRRDGSISSLDIVQDPGYGLGDAALIAVRRWRFRPATYRGEVIEVYYTITVNFRLTK